jgi:homoserine O-acetyltransferase
MLVGGSIGAFQAIEWCIMQPEVIENLVFIAAGVRATPWAIALSEAQRMAIEADPTFFADMPNGGAAGMAAARAMGMSIYRTYNSYNETQADPDQHTKIGNYRASSYQRYQGEKLVRRFDTYSYYCLSQMLDSHDISRNRNNSVENILQQIKIPALIVGISSDILFPTCEQKFIANIMPNAIYSELESKFGHDAFLIENSKLTLIIRTFMTKIINIVRDPL